MKKFLVVVDMQNDFINGSLGTDEAVNIVDAVAKKIHSFDGEIFATFDTHFENYLETPEGKKLPVPHCIKNTDGWQINNKILNELEAKGFTKVEKNTFGSVELPQLIKNSAGDKAISIELIGLCTDICVVSNALLLKANFPQAEITVDSKCCAGVTPTTHKAALETMNCCQINIT